MDAHKEVAEQVTFSVANKQQRAERRSQSTSQPPQRCVSHKKMSGFHSTQTVSFREGYLYVSYVCVLLRNVTDAQKGTRHITAYINEL